MVKVTIDISFDALRGCFIQPKPHLTSTIISKNTLGKLVMENCFAEHNLIDHGPDYSSRFKEQECIPVVKKKISNEYALQREANESRRDNLDRDLANVSFRKTRHYFYNKNPI